jgi:HlyD family secretion protein
MDRRLRNRILIFLVVAGVVAYALVRLSERDPVAKISAVQPARENLVSSISSNGKVETIAPSVMRAQLDTFVDRVYVTEGQQVKRNQLLLELDVHEAAARLAETRSKLLKAQDDLHTAKSGGRSDEAARAAGDLAKAVADRDRLQKNHEALQRLIKQQAATQDELATNDLALTKAQAEVTRLTAAKAEFDRGVKLEQGSVELQVQQLQNEIAALEQKVSNGRIVAPIDGTLYALPVRAGDFVKLGELLAEMADLHKVRVRAYIDEPELGVLEPDEPVKITWDALPNRSWIGKTEVIPKQAVPHNTRSVGELLCVVPNEKQELLPGANVTVRINSKERLNVLTVPRGAVQVEGGSRYVYVVKNNGLGVAKNVLEKRSIQVGIADATSYEVLSGLSLEELVALPGDLNLRDGMAVKVVITDASYLRGTRNE